MKRAIRLALACTLLAGSAVDAIAQRPAAEFAALAAADDAEPIEFSGAGKTVYGDWQADAVVTPSAWRPGKRLAVTATLRFPDTQLAGMAAAGIRVDKLCLLVTAERTFDAEGWMRLASDERMSTLLTPTGLAIEGGVQGASTTRYGYQFKAPFDQFATIPSSQTEIGAAAGTRLARFSVSATLPANLPPGLYRLRFDFGVMVGTRVYNFNGYTFAARPFSSEAGTSTYFYSPVLPASGQHASGRHVNGDRIQARCPWLLLANYGSNGYRGVVAGEDSHRFATSDRSLIPDEVILPMYDGGGTTRLAYSLEPQFPADTIDSLQNVGWDWTNGEWTVRIAGPDGSVVTHGPSKFVAKSGNGPTTKVAALTGWRPQAYGRYTVTATGWIADRLGRRYEGGGTYRFWIAKRMTLATATFQGMPYPVGSTYGRDIQFNPAVPADVQVTAKLFVGSDPANVRFITYTGKASPAGLFGTAQGMKAFPLDAPGEYHGQVLATYTDADGHLWVSTMRHAGIVYPEGSPVIARGKKRAIGGKYVERGETRFEGYVTADGEQHLDHITFPYLAGDVLQIGSEGQGANKIEPVLTFQMPGDSSAWDTRLNGVGTTNLRINTSNGYSPHLYPEYITDIEYYYGAAPRPGFMGRFIVGESTVRAPYWPVSPNSFGGQIGASPNGDAPGDIYRLLGGVVLRRRGQAPMYSGYISSAFLLPKGTNNNRIVAPGSEDLFGPLGEKARFFLVGLRPGTAFELGATFRPAIQIDPILPVSIHFVLTYPDGRRQVADGLGDRFGSFVGPAGWPLDVPGVYRYQLTAMWNGHEGRMPGLPNEGGWFFVYSKTKPTGAAGLRIDGASQRTFSAETGLTITGTSAASAVHYTLLTPGAVIGQGTVPVLGGKFSYTFSPAAVHAKVPLYDIVSITSGKPQIGRVVHLTFFSEERSGGVTFHDVARVILRGTTAITARGYVPAAASAASPGQAALLTGAGPVVTRSSVGRSLAFALSANAEIHAAALGIGLPAREGPMERGAGLATLRAADAEIERLVRSGELLVVSRAADPQVEGRLHERYQQLQEGIPVVGGQVTRQVQEGVTVSILGTLYAKAELRATLEEGLGPGPNSLVVGAEEAVAIVEASGEWRVPVDRPASLAILPLEAGDLALAWQISAAGSSGAHRLLFVSAADGTVLIAVDDRPASDASRDRASNLLAWSEAGALRAAFEEFLAADRPAAAGNGPDHYGQLVRGFDPAAARANAAVVGHVLALAVGGGTNATSGLSVEGVGESRRAEIVRVFLRTFRLLLPSGATFQLARAAMIQSAADLRGEDDGIGRAIGRAWEAVGVW